MKGNISVTRPNRKVTEFFTKKPKTGPAPDQPVYHISSSSSDRSVISISSGDTPVVSVSSKPVPTAGPSTRVATQQANSSRQSGDTRSTAVYVSSSPQLSDALSPSDLTLSSSPGPSSMRGTTRPDHLQSMSNPPSKPRVPVSSTPKNNAKKRRQPPIQVISSDSSDDGVLPVIRVKPSSRNSVSSRHGSRSLSHPSIEAVIAAPIPLSPRQNTLTPSKRPFSKSDTTVLPPTSQTKQSEKSHQPSPPKRARHGSFSSSQKYISSAPGGAGDRGADGDVFIASAPDTADSLKTNPDVDFSPGTAHLGVDMSTASPLHLLPGDSVVGEFGDRALGHGRPPAWTTPRDEVQTVPSSQEDEVELSMDVDHIAMDTDVIATQQHQPPVSPFKSRAEDLIEKIKAKADAEAAAEALLEHNSSAGLDGDLSDLSSLPSESDDDDDELEFDLHTFGKANGSKITRTTGPTPPASVSPDVNGARRSTRHLGVTAPNYAKKLELFRDDTSPASNDNSKADASGKGKGRLSTTASCPLDALLRDHEREDARRMKAEKKRKGDPSSLRSSSPVAPVHNLGIFETPRRHARRADTESPGSDDSSGDRIGEDNLMGDAEREELLGKEDAAAVGKILAGDRVGRGHAEKKEGGVAFWSAIQEGRKDAVPQPMASGGSSPVIQYLHDKLSCEDYQAVTLFINSGILGAVSPTVQVLEWLLLTAMSIVDPALSSAAYRALLVSQREISRTTTNVQLGYSTFLASLLKFGVREHISTLLRVNAIEKIVVVEANQDTKNSSICRFVIMLEALGRSGAVKADAIPSTILSLLLLALDHSAGPELQQDVAGAIESLLGSPVITRILELSTCKSIVQATTSLAFTTEQEAKLLNLLSGCGSSSGRVRRWTAWALLGGDLGSVQECGDVPPLDLLANLFSGDAAARVRLDVDRDTDYDVLGAKVEVLSVALTDVDAYVRLERSAQGTNSGSIDGICNALEMLNGKIVDTRAAYLDRTRTKDAINRLHKRLFYQRRAALEILRGNAGKMDAFVTKIKPKPKSKNSPSAKSKPKPKPVTTGQSHQI